MYTLIKNVYKIEKKPNTTSPQKQMKPIWNKNQDFQKGEEGEKDTL